MTLELMFFYMFGGAIIAGVLGVVFTPNPVHSVMCLIFSFLNAAGLYIVLKAEFLALSTIIVYVGAVAVLFLFIAMTLDMGTPLSTRSPWQRSRMFALLLGVGFGIEMVIGSTLYFFKTPMAPVQIEPASQNTYLIGSYLYTHYGFIFQCLGILLFVAMIGAITITYISRTDKKVKRQNPREQLKRDPTTILKKVSVERGKGI